MLSRFCFICLIFSEEKLAERLWKLSCWNVGRQRTDCGFTRERVCNREHSSAGLAFRYFLSKANRFLAFRTKRVTASFVCVKISLCTVKSDFHKDRSDLRRSFWGDKNIRSKSRLSFLSFLNISHLISYIP